ncbi:fibrillin-1-like [Stylophora pistillata]|uniref:fibrillin-1-like n=1 Tax=Stylophora pistillata TaxID=50429 RepID=UPI000C03DFEF|nr:fibrillin-1-like [Stylophora pistillata]
MADKKTSYDEIINKGKCKTGENNCHPHATCLRNGAEGQSFRCECRRGWIGNGTYCERPIKAVAIISDSPKPIGEEVSFSAFTVSGTNVEYKYSFNTAFSRYGVSSHVFTSPGVYAVDVWAQNDVSNSSESAIVVIQAPVTDISLRILGDFKPCRAVHFIPAATGTNVSFDIDFGDESLKRNITGSVSHYFSRSGEFVINVTASNLVSSITKRFLVNISSSPCDQLFCDIWKVETMFPFETPEKIASLVWSFLHSLKAGPREKRYARIWKFLSFFHPIPYKTLKTLTTGNFSRTLTGYYSFNGSFIELDFIMAGFLSSKVAHLSGVESSFLHPHIRDPIELFTWISSVLLSTEEFLNTWSFSQTRQEYCQNRLSMSTINSALDGYIFGAQMADFPKNGKLSNFLFDYYCPSSSDVTFSWETRYRRFLNLSKTPDDNKIWDPVILPSKLSKATSSLKGFVSPIKEFCLSTFLDLVRLGANITNLESEGNEESICETYITCQQCIFSGASSSCFWCESSNECLSKKSKNQCSKNHTFFKLPCSETCQLSQRCSDCTVRKGCGWCQSLLSDEGPACHEGGPQGPRSPALCNSVEWYQGTCTSTCPVSHGHLCNGKGICRGGKCYCIPGVYGDDCSKDGCVYTAQENDTFQFISRRFKLNGTDIQMANRADKGDSTLAFNFHVTIPNIGTPQDCQNRATSSSFHPLFPRMLRIGVNRAGLHSFCGLFGSLASERKGIPTCDMILSREQCLRTERCAWNVKEPCTGMLLKGCFEITKSLDVLVHQSSVISSPISGNVNITEDSLQITGWPKSEWEGFSVTVSHLKPFNITSVHGGQIIGTTLSRNDSLLPDFVRVKVVHDGALKDPLPYLLPCSPGCSQVIHFYNGICDQDCNTTECSYDNGECITTHFNLSGFSVHSGGINDIFADTSVRLLHRLKKITGEKDILIARGPLSVFSLAKEVVLEIRNCDDLHSLLIFQSYRRPVVKFVENVISQNASLEKITLLTAEKLIELGIDQVSPYGRNGGDYDIAEITTSSLRNQTRFKVGLAILSEARLLDFALVENESSNGETYFHIKIYRQKSVLRKLNDYDPSLYLSTECSSLSWCSGHGICMVNGSCQCDFYYTGKKCQINNCPSQCSGHGTCIDGVCVCNFGWEGYDCSKVKLCTLLCPEHWIGDGVCDPSCNTPMCLHDKGDCQDICVCPDTWLGDGLCDHTCNSTSCDYDGGDCAKKECSPGCASEILGDGICDHQCNTQQCSLDDGDCLFAATCSCSQDIQGDGVCDDECNKASCMYDYGDCTSQVLSDDCPQSCSPPMIGNGFCDVFCNVSSCKMDGGDCNPTATAMRLCYEGCLPRFLGDEACDSACNVQACNFDNGDCPTPIVQECAAECQVDMVGDGICQSECQVEECSFDASDCQCSQGCSNTSIGDGVCDMACFVESCDYDKMDCMCSSSICPKEYLSNGQCDKECNNRICDFDGGDCTCAEGCALTSINDGSCDPACDTKACNFDGLDCGGCESESHLDICDENADCMTSNDSLPYVKCRCRNSFYGDGFSCVKRGNCFNDSNICSENGQCIEGNGTFECYCNEGWVGNGIFCENVDECKNNYDNCGVNANCLDVPGSYKCVCEEGWTGDGYNCTDVNECESNRHLCCGNENCFNTEGNYTCSCKHGWRKNDTYRSAAHGQCYLDMNPVCVDIDECFEDRHNCSTYENQANAICTNAIGGFKCSCEEGWEGDGYFCFDVNECLNESVCPTNQKCHNLPGNHSCHCKDGFTLETSTKECQDLDECALGLAACDPFAFCTNSYGSFKCECMEGFEDKKRVCTEYQCGNQTNNETHSVGINVTYTTQDVCTCIGEFLNTGKSCMDIDECSLKKFDCPASAPLCQNLLGGYECKCDAVDNSSCDPVNPCNSNKSRCGQNMTCIAVGVEHYCVCPDGFTQDENGTTCVDIDECLNPQFYGSCEENADCVNRKGSFECRCRSGYFQSGDACFEINECEGTITKTIAGGLEECKAGVCSSTEACIFRNNSRDSVRDSNTTLVCACDHSDSQQIECIEATVQVIQSGESISSLISIPWYATGASSANISITNQTFHNCSKEMICKNTAGSYECTCQEGYHIDRSKWACQDTDECFTNNTCHSNASCLNTVGSFYCKCNSGFAGDGLTNCSDINECSLKIGNCTLKSVCINTVGGYFCACENGFQRNGTLCQDVDECSSIDFNNCHPRASCGNYIGGYKCSCMSGYTGDGYSCSDIDECKSDSPFCGVHASCYNTPGSYECKCNPGWTGSGTNCTNIDECSHGSHTCIENSYCTDNQGSYTCTCMYGWKRQWFEPYGRCSKCDPNALCSSHGKCLRNGTCDCLRHYRGANCSVCMSEVRCSGHGHCDFDGKCYCDHGWTRQPLDCSICSPETLCSGHGTSNYDYETYKNKSCFCNDNFFGQNCSKACPIVEGEVCGLHGFCNRDPSSLLPCVCLSGYQWNSTSVICEDTDECLLGSHECLPPAQCINTPGSYRCECPTLVGWSFDGKTCNDTDECQYPNVCDSQATCINFPGGFNCSCNTGWRGKGAHPICFDIDECAEGTDRCPGPSKCVNTLGSYYCICDPGWEKVSEFACKDIDECSLGVDGCDPNSACINTAGSWQCTCNSGYYPDPSDARLPICKDINECVQNANACPAESLCVNYAGSYRCNCLSGWRNQGPHKCVDINECSEGSHSCPLNSRCVNIQGSHQCHCNSGFTPPITTTTCQDLDECTTGRHSCSSFGNAYCVNTIGSYTCRCYNCYYMSGSSCKSDCRLETQYYYTTVYTSYRSYYTTSCGFLGLRRCRRSRTRYKTRAALQSHDVWVANRAGAVCPCR